VGTTAERWPAGSVFEYCLREVKAVLKKNKTHLEDNWNLEQRRVLFHDKG
jgi:hypothetical protein